MRVSLWLCGVCLACGCQRQNELAWEPSADVNQLPAAMQASVQAELRKHAGTYSKPQLVVESGVQSETLKQGQAVYQKRCVQCHGVSGDGNGAVAASMYPRPRDYRKGVFKFTSTTYGSKPLRSDLIRTVSRGIHGTSMPAFNLLPKEEIEAVVDYVLVLAQRGELEGQIFLEAEGADALDTEVIETDVVPIVEEAWLEAPLRQIVPLSPQPMFTDVHVEAGRKAFLAKGCSKCHGDDGRGLVADNLNTALKDAWNQPTRAADLTSGMLHGGQRPSDVYNRIFAGINGTPMPGFAQTLRDEPETIWDLVAFVLHVSNRRRAGESPPPGPMVPYLPPAALATAHE